MYTNNINIFTAEEHASETTALLGNASGHELREYTQPISSGAPSTASNTHADGSEFDVASISSASRADRDTYDYHYNYDCGYRPGLDEEDNDNTANGSDQNGRGTTSRNGESAGRKEKAAINPSQFYFPSYNPTIQRYYRFTASPSTPFAALHKRPDSGGKRGADGRTANGGDAGSQGGGAGGNQSGVTGLLRRSAVLPSHGTDPSGKWILVSVGGRSGWARKKLFEEVSADGANGGATAAAAAVASPYGSSVTLASHYSSARSVESSVGPPSQQGVFENAPAFRASEGWYVLVEIALYL